MASDLAQINGFRCSYSLEGEADRPVVLFSHSLGVSQEIWAYQLPIFLKHFRVLRYDIRGHGGSEAPGNVYTLEALASDVSALLEYLQLPKVSFVGVSLGGMIGQTLALRYPEKLKALVLSSTGSQILPAAQEAFEDRVRVVAQEGMGSLVEGILQRWFTEGFNQRCPTTTEWVGDIIRATSVEGFTGCVRALQKLDLLEELSGIQVPTLIVPGELDSGFPISVSEAMQQRIKNSEMTPLHGAAHLGHVEKCHAFNQILCEFLLKH